MISSLSIVYSQLYSSSEIVVCDSLFVSGNLLTSCLIVSYRTVSHCIGMISKEDLSSNTHFLFSFR